MDWIWWVVAAIILFAVEIVSLDFIFMMIAAGSLAAALASALGAPLVVQAIVGGVVALLLIFAVRPIALRHLHPKGETLTGAAALVGSQGTVLERVDAHDGRVRLRGEVWSARSLDPDSSFEPGDTVDVVRLEGVTAVVNQSELQ
jgi:membrane protein implicated in regulation of membrane protease activity